jgi:alpha-L-fucosidase
MPDKDFNDRWYNRVVEVVNKYQPDLVWFDSKLHIIDEQVRQNFLSYYYNKAEQWNKEVVSTYKGEDFEPQTAVLDLERGRLDSLRKIPWLTDTSIDRESWCYIENPKYKSVNTLIDNIVDRVSKNGNTLLNIGPRPDGTIPQPQKDKLLAIGDWFDVNGEAIYGTRYWKFYGEGPTKIKGGSFIDNKEVEYTAKDIRFTTKDDVLYAITLAWPEEHVTIKSLNVLDPEKIESITMLGNKGELEWSMQENGLKIESPKQKPCRHAYSFKIVYNKSF